MTRDQRRRIDLSGYAPDRRPFKRGTDRQELKIWGELRRAFGPEDLDPPQPSPESLAEALVSRIPRRSELALWSVGAEQEYASDILPQGPALPDNPRSKITRLYVDCPPHTGKADGEFASSTL